MAGKQENKRKRRKENWLGGLIKRITGHEKRTTGIWDNVKAR